MRTISDLLPEPGESVDHKEVVGHPQILEGFHGPYKGPFTGFVICESQVLEVHKPGPGQADRYLLRAVRWRTGGQSVIEQLQELRVLEERGREVWPFACVLNEEPSQNVAKATFQVLRAPSEEQLRALELAWAHMNPVETQTHSEPADVQPMSITERDHRKQTVTNLIEAGGWNVNQVAAAVVHIDPKAKTIYDLVWSDFERLCEELRKTRMRT